MVKGLKSRRINISYLVFGIVLIVLLISSGIAIYSNENFSFGSILNTISLGSLNQVSLSPSTKLCYIGSSYKCSTTEICENDYCREKVKCGVGQPADACKDYGVCRSTSDNLCHTECTSNNDDACDHGIFNSNDDICNKDLGRCTECWKGKDETKCKKDQGETCNDYGECVSSSIPNPPPTPTPTCPQGCITCNGQGQCVYANSSTCFPTCKDNEGCNEKSLPPKCEPAECGIPGKQCFSGLVCKNKLCVRCKTDNDCSAGQSCIQDPNPQVPAGFKVCYIQATNTSTQNNTNKCEIDYDCNGGKICKNNVCVDPECSRINGVEKKCPADKPICDGGRCFKPCLYDRNCDSGQVCYDQWECVPATCTKDSECPGMICENNKCVSQECYVNAQCLSYPSEVCINARCAPAVKCNPSNPCNGLKCIGGTCDDGKSECNSFNEFNSVIDSLNNNRHTLIHADSYKQWVSENIDGILKNMDMGQCLFGLSYTDTTTSGINAIKGMKKITDAKKPAPMGIDKINSNGIDKNHGHAVIALSVKDLSKGGITKYEITYLDSNGPGIYYMTCQISRFTIAGKRKSLLYCSMSKSSPTFAGQNVLISNSILVQQVSNFQTVYTSYCRTNSQSAFCKDRANINAWIQNGNYPGLQNTGTQLNQGICTGWTDFTLKVAYLGEFVGCK